MRRAPIVLTGTAAGLAGILSFHARAPERASAVAATPAAAAGGTPATPAGSSGGSGSPSGTQVITGDAIATPYGNAQVQVTISGGRITEIKALQLQGNDPKSVQISSSAEPTLRQEALQKQSAAIDSVSGATFTSSSYEASLQSALDKAGFKAADGSRGSTTVPDDIPQEHHGHDGFGPGGGGPEGLPQGGGVPPQATPPASGATGVAPVS